MTGLLASLGLLPAALSHAIGSETQRPLAVVVVCGTVSAFALTLILMPVAYYWRRACASDSRGSRRSRKASSRPSRGRCDAAPSTSQIGSVVASESVERARR
jgi:hypothetical protein